MADRFRLERPLGQGGMGAVWLAQHVSLQIPCAVKFIHAEAAASPAIRARFEREAIAAARLKSPHVVQILDHGIWEGLPYIAMERLEGEDLAQRLARVRILAPRDIVTIATHVGRALTKAHVAGLVHRDLKPANIFLSRDDEGEIAKVLDFGVAKVSALESTDANTKTGALLGTPYYMSPEQARGDKEIDSRSDLWSLAVVVFQCLTGQLPFKSTALGDLLVKIIVQPPPIPSQVAPVPPGFDAWWERATARDPAHRFQSAKELVESLGVALGVSSAGMSVSAVPEQQAYRGQQPSHAAAAYAQPYPQASPPTPNPAWPTTPAPITPTAHLAAPPAAWAPHSPPTPTPAWAPHSPAAQAPSHGGSRPGTDASGTSQPGFDSAAGRANPHVPAASPVLGTSTPGSMTSVAQPPAPRSSAGIVTISIAAVLLLGVGAAVFVASTSTAKSTASPAMSASASPAPNTASAVPVTTAPPSASFAPSPPSPPSPIESAVAPSTSASAEPTTSASVPAPQRTGTPQGPRKKPSERDVGF
ncbi:Adenylate cyclase [Minicystis rosea]|nr:Adenylate cyclase [Minicystis rosea]